MTVLTIFKHTPDPAALPPASALDQPDAQTFNLAQPEPDYDRLVETIFEADRVVCWF